MLYCASFDVADTDNGLGNISFTNHSTGGPGNDFSVDISGLTATTPNSETTTLFNHHFYGLGNTTGPDRDGTSRLNDTFSANSFTVTVQSAIQTAATAAGGWGTITVSRDTTTGYYTISKDGSATYDVEFANAKTRELFGFSANSTGKNDHPGDQTPDYIIDPTLDDVSDPTTNFEPDAPGSNAATANGDVFGITRPVRMYYRDWFHQFETKAKTLRASAATSHPFTFQELFEVVGADLPFVVEGAAGFGSTNEVFYLRTEGTPWRPRRATPGNDNQFHIGFQTIVIGETVAPG